MESIGVRELRQHASRWLSRVEAGESFQITDRGRPVASLVPVVSSPWEQLVGAGAVVQATSRMQDVVPISPHDGPTMTELLAADRDDER